MRRIKKKVPKPVIHDQWIEITRQKGETVTTRYPPNAEFERLRLERDPPPTLIYRRLNFVHGVPEEYNWTKPSTSVKQLGGYFLHRMLAEDWPEIMQLERHVPHVIPSINGQRRPAAFGPCPCDRCKAEREKEYADD
jgi:hypothetical protein